MFDIELARLVIRLENRYDYTYDLCRGFIVTSDRTPDITLRVSDQELCRATEQSPDSFTEDGHVESVLLYEQLSCVLPAFDAFVMHSSAVAVDGQAYCFAAARGTGKSTHTRYWKQVLGDRLTVINGDKPIYRFLDGRLFAFGTPWCGKENWRANTAAPLKALCLLERGDENAIWPVDARGLLAEISQHFYWPGGGQLDALKQMELIDRTLSAVPVYRLRCKNHVSSAETAISYFDI